MVEVGDMTHQPSNRVRISRPFISTVELLETRRLLSGEYVSSLVLGGPASERIDHVAVDAAGNRTVIGTFAGRTDFAPGRSTYYMTSAGGADIFVARYTPDDRLVWARQIGGAGEDEAGNVALDADGNCVVVGSFTGTTDFDPVKASQSLKTSAGKTDAFACQLSPRGYLNWVATAGAENYDVAKDVAVNPATGDAYVVGWWRGTADFGAGPRVSQDRDGYLWKLTPAGAFGALRPIAGPGDDRVLAVTVKPSDGVYVAGYFTDWASFGTFTNEMNQQESFDLSSQGTDDAFLSTYDFGLSLGLPTAYAADRGERPTDVAVNGDRTYVAMTVGDAGQRDVFVAGLANTGAAATATTLDGTGDVVSGDLAIDPATGGVYLAASFTGTVAGRASAGGYDALFAKFNRRGALMVATAVGGAAGDDFGSAVAYDPAGATVLFGGAYTGRIDLDPAASAFQWRTAVDADDPFLVEYTA
jgi:hypothetical protein